MSLSRRLSVLLLAGLALAAGIGTAHAATAAPGFIVVAPDRGFLGNEEARDAFETFAAERNAALVFVTDERTRTSLEAALMSVTARGAQRVVVLPFFLSRAEPRFRRVESLLSETAKVPVAWARPFGESYFAVEELADRLRGLPDGAGRRVVVVGFAARDEGPREPMQVDAQRLADAAASGLGFERVRVVLEAPQALGTALAEAVKGGERPAIVPFHLGSKLDGMMSFTASVRRAAPAGTEVLDGDVTPNPSIGLWMAREANLQMPAGPGDVGVVVLAHGSDHHWNETMRQAVAPLAERYLVEPAFSMADPQVIERAVRRLERRGARAIVILRVFGLSESFRDDVERLIGLDVERGDPITAHAGHAMGHGHGDHGPARPAARIRSAAVLTTIGGLDDHALFARALVDRARSLSREPGRETVVLVAHGEGDDARNAHWQKVLSSLATRMRAEGGDRFRAIRAGTWREDWPEKRESAVETVRSLVEKATADGGRALVLPARTLGQGPERRLLEGLSFDLGEGFAPHPLFARWAEEQVAAAVAELEGRRLAASATASHGAGPGSPANH